MVLEKILESPLDCKEIKTINPKGNQSWIIIGRTDAKVKSPILWLPDAKSQFIGKDSCWERLKAGGEGDDRGWDGWMASLTQWTWAWANSGRKRRTGKPGMLQSMASQRVGHNWVTEQQQCRHRHREQAYGQGQDGEEGGGRMNGESSLNHIYYHT